MIPKVDPWGKGEVGQASYLFLLGSQFCTVVRGLGHFPPPALTPPALCAQGLQASPAPPSALPSMLPMLR